MLRLEGAGRIDDGLSRLSGDAVFDLRESSSRSLQIASFEGEAYSPLIDHAASPQRAPALCLLAVWGFAAIRAPLGVPSLKCKHGGHSNAPCVCSRYTCIATENGMRNSTRAAFPVPRWLAEFEDAFAILKPTDYGRRARAPQFRVELRRIMRVDRDRRGWNNLLDDFWHRAAKNSFDPVVVSVKVKIGTMVTPMNQEIYVQFIPHILSDVAERRTDAGQYLLRGQRRWILINGQRRRVFVHGDHVCYQSEQFHDSDGEFRLTMAVTAAELIEQERLSRSWGSNTKACLHVAEALLNSGCERLKRRFLKSDRRRQTQDKTRAASTEPPLFRLAETIRRQVRRYREQHTDWRREFDNQVGLFRSSKLRDPGWYQEVERGCVEWLSDFEKRREFQWCEAMKIVGMARLYQEQHKFDQAVTIYRKAILIARKALMNETFRQVVLGWLRASVKACLRKTHAVPDPRYRGPRANAR